MEGKERFFWVPLVVVRDWCSVGGNPSIHPKLDKLMHYFNKWQNSIKIFLMSSNVCNYVSYGIMRMRQCRVAFWKLLIEIFFRKLINFTFINFAVNFYSSCEESWLFYGNDQDAFIIFRRHILWNSWSFNVDAVLVAWL